MLLLAEVFLLLHSNEFPIQQIGAMLTGVQAVQSADQRPTGTPERGLGSKDNGVPGWKLL